jgi:RNA polymerase sigma factor (sigma-70 family)
MSEIEERFERNRVRLRGVAYRMLGSLNEADDAVQEAWLRLERSEATEIDNLDAWLTTVVARVCLDLLRSRESRREDPVGAHVPDPVVSRDESRGPEDEAVLADSVGLALLVVLETMAPAERLAFVLHDLFAMPFEEIAPIVGRSATAARQLASRARRRVQGPVGAPETDRARQREIVDAFVAASREGDFDALLRVLDPDVVMRLDRGERPPGASREIRGADAVVAQGFRMSGDGWLAEPAIVNGGAGVVITNRGRAFAVLGFTVSGDRIAEIDVLADAERLRRVDLSAFEDR